MNKINLSFRSLVFLTAMKSFIRNGDFGKISDRSQACKYLVDLCYEIADLADTEGKKRHNADQQLGKRVQEAGR